MESLIRFINIKIRFFKWEEVVMHFKGLTFS